MSHPVTDYSRPESEVGGCEVLGSPHLAREELLARYGTSFPSPDSSFDEDRPHSRLTIIESPTTDDYDYDDEFSQFSLDSPDPEDPPSPLSSGLRPGGCHTCEECDKNFSSPGKLRQHEYSHTGETPYECKIPDCDKKFTSKFKLKRHILIHSQTKTFLCDVCHRAFRRKDHLRNHEKVHDPGKTIHTCSYDSCGRTYNSLTSFRKHQAMHSAEEGELDCKICKMVLQTQEDLMNHLKVHAGSRTMKGSLDKKFICGQCDKKFFTRKDLKRHSVVHTGNREFSCPHCTQRFGRKDHMTRHAKKTHANFYDSSERPERTRLISTPLPGEEEEDFLPRIRPSRKERSVSDPGPPLLITREVKVPSYSTKVEPIQEMATPSQQQKVIEEFEKLVTQDTLDLVKAGEAASHPPSEPYQAMSEEAPCSPPPLHPVERSEYVLNGHFFASTLPQTTREDSKEMSDMQDQRREPLHAKIHQTSSTNEMLKYLMREERSGPFDNQLGEDVRALKELLAEKESIDFNAFMNDIAEERPPILIHSRKKVFLNPPSPSLNEDSLLPKYLEDGLIKMEPPSSPGSPIDATMLQSQYSPPQYEVPHCFPALQTKARTIYIRTQSQDSLTRTKNPVLPSIHAESSLVVPEPKMVKYPVTVQDSVSLDFSEEREDSLADLRGPLFLSEEDGHNIFQPWN